MLPPPSFLPSLSLWVKPLLLSDVFPGFLWLPPHFFSQAGGAFPPALIAYVLLESHQPLTPPAAADIGAQ